MLYSLPPPLGSVVPGRKLLLSRKKVDCSGRNLQQPKTTKEARLPSQISSGVSKSHSSANGAGRAVQLEAEFNPELILGTAAQTCFSQKLAHQMPRATYTRSAGGFERGASTVSTCQGRRVE